ncbi:MAG: acyltransferase [Candidatus Aenigmarchaeota archaeon]|nr:acyltransferase [Candidatus Aenigmarchaeota archaeon]
MQEVFSGPFFPALVDESWFQFAEPDDGQTVTRVQELARKHNMVIVAPFYERDGGRLFNTAAVIDADGTFLGKYRKSQIPLGDGFNEKYYFRPGDLGLPVFDTAFCKVGIYVCYDRHFPAGFRILKERGAQVVFVPSATVASTSQKIWEHEAMIRAYDAHLFVVFINRVGQEGIGDLRDTRFYGTSLIVDPNGWGILAKGSEDKDEVVSAKVNVYRSILNADSRYQTWRDEREDLGITQVAQRRRPLYKSP